MASQNMINQDIFRDTLEEFLREFVENPYLCYTEHGQHALFFARLFQKLPKKYAAFPFDGRTFETCLVQKEYPTATKVGKDSKRQHWDISLLKVGEDVLQRNQLSISRRKEPLDDLELTAVAEFGMNTQIEHLIDDYLRVSHPSVSITDRYVVQFYRISESNNKISGRDWSIKSQDIKNWFKTDQERTNFLAELAKLSIGCNVIKSIDVLLSKYDKKKQEAIHSKFPKEWSLRPEFRPVTFYISLADLTDPIKPSKIIFKVENGNIFKIA